MHSPKFLIVGGGAIGSACAFYLHQAGYSVTLVCRSNHDLVLRSGLKIQIGNSGASTFKPKIARTCEEAARFEEYYDFVLVAAKAIPSAMVSLAIAPVVKSADTCLILVQNGVGIEDEYLARFPQNPILSCVAYCFAQRLGPAHTLVSGPVKLEMGACPGDHPNVPQAAQAVMSCMHHAGIAVSWSDSIQERRWLKLALNASFNPICALTLSSDETLFSHAGEGAKSVIRGVMEEIVAIAQAAGYPSVTVETAEKLHAAAKQKSFHAMQPSMLADVLAGRDTEVEAILGNPLRIARGFGVDTPRLEMLYVLVGVINSRTCGPSATKSVALGTVTQADR